MVMASWYLIVALHSIDECLISNNLCVSIEEGLETILGLLKLLLGYLWKQGKQWTPQCYGQHRKNGHKKHMLV